MRVEPLRRRQPSTRRLSRPSAWCRNPRGPLASITNRAVMRTERPSALAFEHRAIALVAKPFESRLVEVDGAFGLRLLGRAPDRSPAGTSACRRSRRAGSPPPAAAAGDRRRPRTASPGWWKKNVNPRFRPQATSGRGRCHVPHFENGANPRQIVAIRELLDQQIGERRGGFADGESRMAAALDERRRAALA